MWTPDGARLADGATKHEQLTNAITAAVAAGELAPNERLPTVRALAESLALAANTVARSYRELERAGVIETRGRNGSFVTVPDVRSALRSAAATYVSGARALGVGREAAVDAVREAWSG